MADYSDYLNYLRHVDDTTLQEFKKKEDDLRHQIDVVRDQCQRDIRAIKERAAEEKAQLQADNKAAIGTLTSKHEEEINKILEEKDQSEASYKAELETLQADNKAAIGTLTSKHEEEINKILEEKDQLEASYKAELEKLKAHNDAVVAQLKSEYHDAVETLNSNAEQKLQSEVQLLLKKIDDIESSHQSEIRSYNEKIQTLKEDNERSIAEFKIKQEQVVAVINQQNQEKMNEVMVQLQDAKADIESREGEWGQKFSASEEKSKKMVEEFSRAKTEYERKLAGLNQELQNLSNDKRILLSETQTLSTQKESATRKNVELIAQVKGLQERIAKLEAGFPPFNLRTGLLKVFVSAVLIIAAIIFVFV